MKRAAAAVLLAVLAACSSGGEETPEDALTLVAGEVGRLAFDPALLKALPLPVTVEALEAGRARATLAPVMVDERRSSVVWSGGTPLVIEAVGRKGRLRLGPVTAEASSQGLALALDGVTGRLPAGSYRLRGAVAVGSEGLGEPREAVEVEAVAATRIGFGGSATLRLPRRAVTVSGPGTVALVGDVELTSESGDRRARAFTYGPGPYRADLVWVGDYLEVDAALEGPVRIPSG